MLFLVEFKQIFLSNLVLTDPKWRNQLAKAYQLSKANLVT